MHGHKQERILKEIEEVDNQDDNSSLSEDAKLKRMELISQLRMIDNKLDCLCRQKAREKWLKHGETNSRYYHSILRWRQLRNEVKGVEVGNQWNEEPNGVCKEAKRLLEDRFHATHDYGVRLGAVEFKTLPLEASLSLILNFIEEEIKEAVWQCEGSKSPDPAGFNFNFIKKNWASLKQDIVEVVHSFQKSGCIPTKLYQYRPISLMGAIYKIITKVLSCRIKGILPLVIDDSQSTFLKDKDMLDSVLVANEVVEELRRHGRSGLCLKMDYEKAYDSVRWDFLIHMLQRQGFHSKWTRWVKGCLESMSVSVLVNGSPTVEFRPIRGLRQGDLLAPFLFLIIPEGLVRLVRQALKANLLNGVKVERNEVEVCVLQFADDTLFMCKDSYNSVISIKAILRCYKIVFGLKINFHKSKLVDINVERSSLKFFASSLNCTLMRVPFKYLGVVVEGNPRNKLFWELILNKSSDRLTARKGRFLSLAGRICLIKLVLTALPLFYSSLFKAPTSVYNKIISTQRNFLWAWGREKRSISWVSWENVCKPMAEGGRGEERKDLFLG